MNTLHFISKILFLSIILLNYSCSSNSKPTSEVFSGNDNEWTTKDITQSRDITQYEQGGHFWCSLRPNGNEEDRFNGEKKVRDFIWQHWTKKKRGYIKISCGGVDTSSTTHYFIEPSENGVWNVARRHIFIDSEDKRTIFDDFVTVGHSEAESEKDNWRLILKTKDGKTFETIPQYY
jgi:hypothetical protein